MAASDDLMGSSHVSGLLMRSHDRWPSVGRVPNSPARLAKQPPTCFPCASQSRFLGSRTVLNDG